MHINIASRLDPIKPSITLAVTAKAVLPDDPDYARLFQVVNKNNHNVYEGYQKRTERQIPLVILEPASSSSSPRPCTTRASWP